MVLAIPFFALEVCHVHISSSLRAFSSLSLFQAAGIMASIDDDASKRLASNHFVSVPTTFSQRYTQLAP